MSLKLTMCCLAQNDDDSQDDTDFILQLVSQWKVFKNTADCNNAEMVQIVKLLFSAFAEDADEEEKQLFKELSETFSSFLAEKNVDGKLLLEYDEKQFADDIVAFSNNDKVGRVSRGMLEMLKTWPEDFIAPIKQSLGSSLEWKKVGSFLHHLLYSYHVFIIIS